MSKTGKGWTILLDSSKIVSSYDGIFWEDGDKEDDAPATTAPPPAAPGPGVPAKSESPSPARSTPPHLAIDANPFAALDVDDVEKKVASVTPPSSLVVAPPAPPPRPRKPKGAAPTRQSARLNPPPPPAPGLPPAPARRSERLAIQHDALTETEMQSLAHAEDDVAPPVPGDAQGELQIGVDGTPDGQKARLVADGNRQATGAA